MRRNLLRNVFFLAIVAVLLSGSLLAMHFARASQDARVALSSQTVPLVARANFLRAAEASQVLNLSIGLRPRNPDDLKRLLQGIYTPGSPDYHHYLTPEEYNQLFAPSSTEVQEVVSFLHSQGITVNSVASNNLLINATATVAVAQRAFSISINVYQYAQRTFYANAQPPALPVALQPYISSIGGLDNSAQYSPRSQNLSTIPQKILQRTATSGFGPTELAGVYDTAPLLNADIHGENQTIAIFELDGYEPADIQQYFQNYNLATPEITNILVDGAKDTAGEGAIEVELDIEIAGAIAPRAKQLIYEGPNSTQGVNDTYNRIVTDNQAQVVSISWGLCERNSGAAELQTLNAIFQQGAAQGIAFYAAAGDAGAYDCGDTNLGVDSPASDPFVTGVGGTQLQPGPNNSYGQETVWSNAGDTQRGPKGAGGGGGISSAFVQPSWQTGVSNDQSSGQPCSAPSGQFCRQVPDISADADPKSGYAVYCTVKSSGCPTSGWVTVGGTSAAAPFWAGSTVLINQYLQSSNLARVGSANPALYGIFQAQQEFPAFHDVTSGDNLFYKAGEGYDLASGLGSPDVYNLARDLAAISTPGGTPTPTPAITPTPGSTPVATPTGNPASTPVATPTVIPQPGSGPLLQNAGFESGRQAWQVSSAGEYDLISRINPHSGSFSAYLCGYTGCNDRIWQTFTVPAAYTSLRLSYWWFSSTTQFSQQCLDSFTVVVSTPTGQSIKTLQTGCNNQATNNWRQQNVDLTAVLTPYKGQQVTLLFAGTTHSGFFLTTNFFVDDVSLIAR